ncbi:MAG: type II secretion system protein [bacterium]|nr:type II secretion system protein [Candidatus Jorgensenbacteria bacterium]
MNNLKKGFTLIELLIVIAILAILSVAVILVLNPAQLIKQGRDATRVSDMAAINSAIAVYMSDVDSPGIGGINNAQCASPTYTCTNTTSSAPFNGGSTSCTVTNASTTINGTGWVTVDLTKISAGAPLSKLPMDPVNSTSYMYAYGCNLLTYKLGAVMESTKYASNATGDGGTSAGWYEVGNKIDL